MDWRQWIFDTLRLDAPFEALVPQTSIFAAGALTGSPSERPFIVITLGSILIEMRGDDVAKTTAQFVTLWAHDDSGDYTRIGQILAAARVALVKSVPGAIFCRWEGDSGDLANSDYGTITRNSEFKCIGRE